MFITVELLKSKGACESQVELFKKMFPNGVEATEEACASVAHLFDFYWLVDNLLPIPAQRVEYNAQHTAILADYEAKLAAILAEYDAKRVWVEYWVEYRVEYWAKREAILAERRRAVARAFGRISST